MEQKKNTVSIIVPIYNKEKYIEKSINSFISQSFRNIEIILINDGSTDRSEEICLEFKNRDSRIIYRKIKNSGVCVARNEGIKIATGKYCIFIDGDDFIEETMIEKMYTQIEKNNGDLIICNMFEIENEIKRKLDFFIKTDKNKMYSFKEIIRVNPILFHSCGNKLFKRQIVEENNIIFFEGSHSYEDLNFVFKYCAFSAKNLILEEPLYNYLRNEDSVTKSSFGKTEPIEKVYSSTLKSFETFLDIKYYLEKKNKYSELYGEYLYKMSSSNIILVAQKALQNNYIKNGETKLKDLIFFSKKIKKFLPVSESIKKKIRLKIRLIIFIIFRRVIRLIINNEIKR